MVNSAKASDLGLIEPVLKKYKNTAGSLITVRKSRIFTAICPRMLYAMLQ